MAFRILRRLTIFVLSVFVSSVLVFAFMAVLPGDPARVALGVDASEESVQALREQFGLDQPLFVQYLDWVRGLLTLDPEKATEHPPEDSTPGSGISTTQV